MSDREILASKELLPCPWCGSFIDEADPIFVTLEVNEKDGAALCCEFCDAHGPAAFDEEAARVSWNERGTSHAHRQLMEFYNVTTLAALIDAQSRHVERLQSRLPKTRELIRTQVREG